ncbi:tRNA-dihydrouridine(16) synthase [Bienertia sinuspersici]
MADNTEVKIVGVFNNALIHTKHESTILLGCPFVKTSKALINVANASVVLESNGEKVELNMIDKSLIPEANVTDYVANYLK